MSSKRASGSSGLATSSLDVKNVEGLAGPAKSIAEVAGTGGADLIVTGTVGRTAMGNLFLGSTTQRLIQIAHQPVLAVPPEALAAQ